MPVRLRDGIPSSTHALGGRRRPRRGASGLRTAAERGCAIDPAVGDIPVGSHPALAVDRGAPLSVHRDIVIDDDAPFQIDIDGGVVLLDVSWGALTTVLPVVHALARSSSIAMYLPYEGEIVPRPPTASWREPFEYVGRLVRPDEDVDLSPGWQLRQDREVQLIDDAVDVGHGDGDWHHGP